MPQVAMRGDTESRLGVRLLDDARATASGIAVKPTVPKTSVETKLFSISKFVQMSAFESSNWIQPIIKHLKVQSLVELLRMFIQMLPAFVWHGNVHGIVLSEQIKTTFPMGDDQICLLDRQDRPLGIAR